MKKLKVLLVVPSFYGFDSEIKSALIANGCDVRVVYEKPVFKMGLLQLFVQKLPKSLYRLIFDLYVKGVVSIDFSPDKVLFIRGEHWEARHIIDLKKRFPLSGFSMYQWDFSYNLPNFESQISFFDSVYTFDSDDARKYGIHLKPLFYKQSWSGVLAGAGNKHQRYMVSFIGTDHSDRYEFLRSFKRINGFSDDECFFYLFRSRWSFYYNKIFVKGSKMPGSYCGFMPRPLNENESIEVFLSSRAVLDITQSDQAGLTARTFEALALSKKIITTNPHIKNYDFYDSRNIFIVDRKNPIVPKDFFLEEANFIGSSLLEKYSSINWVKDFIV